MKTSRRNLKIILALFALLPLAAVLPSVAAIAVLATVLAVLNAIEYARVEHIGWRAMLEARGEA